MRDFNQPRDNRGKSRSDGRNSGRGNFRRKDRDDREPVTMHKVICDGCNEECEVPFRPSGDKPVYCSSCFRNKRPDDDRAPRRDSSRSSSSRDSFKRKPDDNKGMVRQLETMFTKIDKLADSINKLAEAMTADKIEKKIKPKPELIVEEKPVKKPAKKKPPVKKTKKK